jgi:hypothetical protein
MARLSIYSPEKGKTARVGREVQGKSIMAVPQEEEP